MRIKKVNTSNNGVECQRSFIYTKNSRGPSIDSPSIGTQQNTFLFSILLVFW